MTENTKTTTNNITLSGKILGEPTLHFLLVAVVIFALYGINQSGKENLLEINQGDIDARIFIQELSGGEELSAEQREQVKIYYIEEQMLVREALAMNLDRDERIHNILAQKMRHVLSANIIQPTAAELVDFYNENASRYEIPAALNLEELVFNSSEPLQQALLSALQNGAEAETLLAMAEGTLSALPNVNSVDLANIFDPEFARQLVAAELGNWRGPFISNRGQHWLRVLERNSARTPPLYTIADRVRLDWISAEEDARLQQEIDKLLNQYTIIINNSAEE
jgi:hypothetical protein